MAIHFRIAVALVVWAWFSLQSWRRRNQDSFLPRQDADTTPGRREKGFLKPFGCRWQVGMPMTVRLFAGPAHRFEALNPIDASE
jgi:hypothetical protein